MRGIGLQLDNKLSHHLSAFPGQHHAAREDCFVNGNYSGNSLIRFLRLPFAAQVNPGEFPIGRHFFRGIREGEAPGVWLQACSVASAIDQFAVHHREPRGWHRLKVWWHNGLLEKVKLPGRFRENNHFPRGTSLRENRTPGWGGPRVRYAEANRLGAGETGSTILVGWGVFG